MKAVMIKYNAGNIRSVSFALERIGITPILSDDPEVIRSADKIIFPGVGEAGSAMKFLKERRLYEVIRNLKQPVLGICLGMQCAVIEFARNVLGLKDAHSREMNPATSSPVIDLLEAQKNISHMGGTMRLGSYTCKLEEGTLAQKIYGTKETHERHRHRYEFNNEYIKQFKEAGMVLSGINPDAGLVEIIELPKHPFYIGVQFHPEYRSTVENPHPLFVAFVKAALAN